MGEASIRLARRRWPVVALAAYGAIMVPMAFHFSDLINPDGVAYLRIAGYYLSGDVAKAVSGYWSPLYSWLLMPWLAVGVPGLLATKLLGVLLAMAWVVGVALLGRRFLENAITRTLLIVAAAVSVLTWSMEIRADLLLAVVLTYYFYFVSDPAVTTRPARGFACGLLGGLAYLAKAFAFPFFITHFLGTVGLRAWAQPGLHSRKRYVAVALAGMLGFLVLAAPWVGVLFMKYGRLTISTAVGPGNMPGSVSRGARSLEAAPFPPELTLSPVEPGRLTAWEAPDELYARSPGATSRPAHAVAGSGRLQVILANLIVIRNQLSDYDYFHLALAALLGSAFVGLLRGRASASAARYLWGTFTVVLYAVAYLPLWAREERYFWPIAGLLMVLTFGLVEEFVRVFTRDAEHADGRRVPGGRWVALAALVVAFSYAQVGSHWLLYRYQKPRANFGRLAAQLEEEAGRRGATLKGPIAGNYWPYTVYLAYTMNQPSYGSTTTEDPALLAAELSRLGVRTFFVFNNEALAERLKQSDGFRPLAELSMIPQATPPATLAAFEVPGRSAGR